MSGVDPFLVVGLTILMFVMLVINVYILVYWQHPDDSNQSYLSKVLIIFGLQLSAVSVLMLPVGKSVNVFLRPAVDQALT
jgi:LMBR1 domain-containing protein 1